MIAKAENTKLRFAALIRVSTEQQEQTGESLRTQKTEIETAVKYLGGDVVEWYGGQEHATPGHEKKEVDRLLGDASKSKFDAVIVTDADRWSRDNTKSRQGLDLLEQQSIRFFVGNDEQNLANEDHRLILGIHAEIGQFFASKQKRKSLTNRIKRAERGVPTCGKLPYGRTFDAQTEQWGIDKQKQDIIETIAKRFLSGESLAELAEEFKMNLSNLHKILTKRCGTEWEIEFKSNKLKIHEKILIKIPRLLPDNVIEAIRKRLDANRTYNHGHGKAKNKYLLGRRIFCGHCNYTMFGQTNHNGHRYYRHAHTKRQRKCNCTKTWIPAEQIEDYIMLHLLECFGNAKAVKMAMEKAIPNLEKIREYEKQLEHIENETQKIKTNRERILRWVNSDKITEKDAENQLDTLKQKEAKLQTKRQQINDFLNNRPNPKKIKEAADTISARFLTIRKAKNNKPYTDMTYEEKLSLVEMVFSGKMPDGRKMGVYITWDEKGWKYAIHGQLINKNGLLPMKDYEKESRIENGFNNVKQQNDLLAVIKNASYLLNTFLL